MFSLKNLKILCFQPSLCARTGTVLCYDSWAEAGRASQSQAVPWTVLPKLPVFLNLRRGKTMMFEKGTIY